MCREICTLGYIKGFYCKTNGSIWTNTKYPMSLNIWNFSMSFNFMSFLSKYLPLCVTRTRVIFFQKLQCVDPMPEKMQVPVKLFLYSFCVHIKILVTVGVTLKFLYTCSTEVKSHHYPYFTTVFKTGSKLTPGVIQHDFNV